MLNKIAGYLVPKDIASDPSQASLARRYLGVFKMLLMVIVVMSCSGVLFQLFGDHSGIILMVISEIIALTAFNILLVRLFRTFVIPLLISNIGSVSLMVYGMTLTGGISSPILFAILTLPVITITFGDNRIFYGLCVAIAVSILGVYWGQLFGFFPSEKSNYFTDIEQLFSLAGAFCLTAVGGRLARNEIKKGRDALLAAKETAESEARVDMLTGLLNRRAFVEMAQTLISRTARKFQKKPNDNDENIYLAMLDIDFFKTVNDTHGHAAGDMVLKEVAKTLQSHTRDFDFMSRVGGEEFATFLECENHQGACLAGERLRRCVEELSLSFEGQKISVTISIGISPWRDKDDLDTLLRKADAALYTAKDKGRNCVIFDPT